MMLSIFALVMRKYNTRKVSSVMKQYQPFKPPKVVNKQPSGNLGLTHQNSMTNLIGPGRMRQT